MHDLALQSCQKPETHDRLALLALYRFVQDCCQGRSPGVIRIYGTDIRGYCRNERLQLSLGWRRTWYGTFVCAASVCGNQLPSLQMLRFGSHADPGRFPVSDQVFFAVSWQGLAGFTSPRSSRQRSPD
jgi:hypothetical protein